MASRNKGESKQGLIIALTVFVILSIALGVTTYYGFDGQTQLADQKKDAEQKRKVMEDSRNWEGYKALLYKAYIGQPSKEDLESLADLRGKYERSLIGKNEKDKQEVDDLTKKLETELGWDKATSKPLNDYSRKVAALTAELAKTQALLAAEKNNTARALAEMEQQRAANNAEKDRLQAEFAKAKKEADDARNEKLAAVVDRQELIKKIEAENTGLKSSNADTEKKFKASLEAKDNLIKGQQTVLQKFRDKEKPESLLDFESPRGKIVSLDRRGSMAYINLGSADGVKEQLTFSVFRTGGGLKEGRQRKGALEVVRVLDPHLSMARVTEVTDPLREPVTSGDLVYNPSCNPNQRQRVAVVGLVDLDGDGNDDSVQFIRSLEKQGVIVDEYLDMNDLTFKGPGMNIQTNYLIVGERPEITSYTSGDTRTERLKEVLARMGDKQTEAVKLGVTVVPVRRFMALIGMQLPRNPLPPTFRTATRQSVTTQPGRQAEKPAAEEKGETAPKDKDDGGEPPAKPAAKAKDEDKPAGKTPPRGAKPSKGKPAPKEKDDGADKDDGKTGQDKEKEEK